jgi:hypothetical protein
MFQKSTIPKPSKEIKEPEPVLKIKLTDVIKDVDVVRK